MQFLRIVFYFFIWQMTPQVFAREIFKVGALLDEDSCLQESILNSVILKSNSAFGQRVQFEVITEKLSLGDVFANSNKICNLLQSDPGIVGIFGPSSISSSSLAQSITSKHEMPYIQYHWRPSSALPSKTSINVHPEATLLAKAYATIVRNMNWKSFVILYEKEDGLMRLQEVLKMHTLQNENKLNLVSVRQLAADGDHRLILKEIKESTEANILLDCETSNILNILEQAKKMEMLENYYNYFLTSLDAYALDYSKLDTNANISVVKLLDLEPNESKMEALRDLSASLRFCNGLDYHPQLIPTNATLLYDSIQLFVNSFQELHFESSFTPAPIFCDSEAIWENGLLFSTFMKRRHVDLLTGPMKFNDVGERTTFRLHVLDTVNRKFSKSAEWDSESPEDLKIVINDTENRGLNKLQERPVRVSSRIGEPYLRRRTPNPGEVLQGNDRYEGYSMDLIQAVADILNFTFVFEITEGNKYGNYDKDTKQWNGLIKDLLDRKADLAVCDLTITHERREVVDFSSPFMTLGISILYKKPKKETGSMFAFMEPLSFDVWIYTSTLYLAVSILLYLIARMAPGDWENPHPCDPNPEGLENIWDLKNSLWLTLGSIMTQGCDILPKGISSRTATSMWWFFSLIMTSSYTANMAAFLTKAQMEPSINSAESLAQQTKIKYGTVNGGATQAFFEKSNFTTFKRMYNQMQSSKPSVFEKDNAAGVARVQTSKNRLYAFLMESSSLEYEIEKNCDLKQVGNWLDNKGYGIAMPVNSLYRSDINRAVLKLQENGVLGRLKEKWWKTMAKKNPCLYPVEEEGENSNELALANVGGVFLVLGVGVVLAFILAIIEFLWSVHNVSVEEHISFCQAFTAELRFVVNIWETKKRVKSQLSQKSSTPSCNGEERKSREPSILKGASLFLDFGGSKRNLTQE